MLQAEEACISCECPYHRASPEKVKEYSYPKPSGLKDVRQRVFRLPHGNILPSEKDSPKENEISQPGPRKEYNSRNNRTTLNRSIRQKT